MWAFAVMMRKTGVCITVSHGTDKGILMSHMQGVTDIGFVKLDHMVQTLNFLGVLRAFNSIDDYLPELR